MTNSTNIAVLSVGPADEHQTALAQILQQSRWLAGTGARGTVKFSDVPHTVPVSLHEGRVPIVLCDDDSGWREMLHEFRSLPDPPSLIVTSRLADDRLWSEALNLGAYDVLAKPYDSKEVIRVLDMAWMRWVERSAVPALKNRKIERFAMSA